MSKKLELIDWVFLGKWYYCNVYKKNKVKCLIKRKEINTNLISYLKKLNKQHVYNFLKKMFSTSYLNLKIFQRSDNCY